MHDPAALRPEVVDRPLGMDTSGASRVRRGPLLAWAPMRRPALALLALTCAACGARTSLGHDDAERDGAAERPDAAVLPARSCWSEPSCIEADFTSELAYREVGEVTPTGSALYLNGSRAGTVSMMVKLMRDATPGVEPYDPDDGNVFVVARHGDASCTLVADIALTRVDDSPGGVTEGTFAGELFACDALGEIREGRFRLTAPP